MSDTEHLDLMLDAFCKCANAHDDDLYLRMLSAALRAIEAAKDDNE